jgi:hypothetical protein
MLIGSRFIKEPMSLFEKMAAVTSNTDASIASDTFSDSSVSPKERLKAYKEWRDYTSKQEPKSKLKSALKGALGTGLLGAGVGGLLGAPNKMGIPGALIGGGVGALTGGIGGLAGAMRHNDRIREAKSKMGLNDEDSMSHLERTTARARAMKARQMEAERRYDRFSREMDRHENRQMRRELMSRNSGNINYNVRL